MQRLAAGRCTAQCGASVLGAAWVVACKQNHYQVEMRKGEGDLVHPEGDCHGSEFNVIEQGVEVTLEDPDQFKHVETANVNDQDEGFSGEANEEGTDDQYEVHCNISYNKQSET